MLSTGARAEIDALRVRDRIVVEEIEKKERDLTKNTDRTKNGEEAVKMFITKSGTGVGAEIDALRDRDRIRVEEVEKKVRDLTKNTDRTKNGEEAVKMVITKPGTGVGAETDAMRDRDRIGVEEVDVNVRDLTMNANKVNVKVTGRTKNREEAVEMFITKAGAGARDLSFRHLIGVKEVMVLLSTCSLEF